MWNWKHISQCYTKTFSSYSATTISITSKLILLFLAGRALSSEPQQIFQPVGLIHQSQDALTKPVTGATTLNGQLKSLAREWEQITKGKCYLLSLNKWHL